MITLSKIQTYQRFLGDQDGWARTTGGHDASGIDDAHELVLQHNPLRRIHLDLENGKLHALTEIEASLGDTA